MIGIDSTIVYNYKTFVFSLIESIRRFNRTIIILGNKILVIWNMLTK